MKLSVKFNKLQINNTSITWYSYEIIMADPGAGKRKFPPYTHDEKKFENMAFFTQSSGVGEKKFTVLRVGD